MANVNGTSNANNDPYQYYTSTSNGQVQNDQSLGKNEFLNLLLTQLKYQDPMSPMDNTAFVSQMAQFSALEQMQQVNDKMAIQNYNGSVNIATAIVGKNITAINPDTKETISGVVSGVSFDKGIPKLVVNNDEIDLSWVTLVG